MEFSVIQGDIANQEADGLVNAAGTSLQMGSGVAGALRRDANGPFNEEAVSKGPIDLGGVAVTDAYDLDVERFRPYCDVDPEFGDVFATVREAGVGVHTITIEGDAPQYFLRDASIPIALSEL